MKINDMIWYATQTVPRHGRRRSARRYANLPWLRMQAFSIQCSVVNIWLSPAVFKDGAPRSVYCPQIQYSSLTANMDFKCEHEVQTAVIQSLDVRDEVGRIRPSRTLESIFNMKLLSAWTWSNSKNVTVRSKSIIMYL